MKWLTPEDAVAAANLSLTSEELIEYTLESEDEETIEERFQKVGLLFDRERWQAQKPYLVLLSQTKVKKAVATESLTPTSDSDSINNILTQENEENALFETEESRNLQSEPKEEPYIFEKCTVELHLTFKPDDGHPDGRIVIISASSHGDFPVSGRIGESSLGELPPPLKELLEQLVADFPNRQVRRQIANARNQKKRTANPSKPRSEASITTAAPNQSKTTGTQLTIFGI